MARPEWAIFSTAPDELSQQAKILELLPYPELRPDLQEVDLQSYWENFLDAPHVDLRGIAKKESPLDEIMLQLEELNLIENEEDRALIEPIISKPERLKKIVLAWQVFEETEEEEELYPLISILGALGSGKSALLRSLKDALSEENLTSFSYEEDIEEIEPTLKEYYRLKDLIVSGQASEEERFQYEEVLFEVQTWFAENRFDTQLDATVKSELGIVLIDAPLPLDAAYFLAQVQEGNVSDEKLAEYQKIVRVFFSLLPPVKTIYLYNAVYSVETLVDRIIKRSREMEVDIDLDPQYLAILLDNNCRLTEILVEKEKDLMIVNSEEFDFSEDNEKRVELAKKLLDEIFEEFSSLFEDLL